MGKSHVLCDEPLMHDWMGDLRFLYAILYALKDSIWVLFAFAMATLEHLGAKLDIFLFFWDGMGF